MTAATSRLRRRGIGAGVAALVGLSGLGLAAVPAQAAAGFDPAASRVAGIDRFDTAAQTAVATFPTGADTVIVANGYRSIDALSANYVAGLEDAPILLTDTNTVPQFTIDAIKKLGAKNVVVFGDTVSVSESARTQLAAAAGIAVADIESVSGDDRFATAAEAYLEGGTDLSKTVFLARGDFYGNDQVAADALAAGPIAYKGTPVLLTNAATLPASTRAALVSGEVEKVIFLGTGITDAVKAAVAAAVPDADVSTTIGGIDRSETAAKLAASDIAKAAGIGTTGVALANGYKVDALAAGPWAATKNYPILLTDDTRGLGTGTAEYLNANVNTLTGAAVFGDEKSVSAAIVAAAKVAGETGTDPAGNQAFAVTSAITGDVTQTVTLGAETPNVAADDRTYTVTGLEAGVTYRVTLVNTANIRVAANGAVTFLAETEPASLTGFAAVTGDQAAANIASVNGAAPSGAKSSIAQPVNGQFTFALEGVANGSVTPVFYKNGAAGGTAGNGGTSPRLEITATETGTFGAPAEAFGIGGAVNYVPAEATALSNDNGGQVIDVDSDANSYSLDRFDVLNDNGTPNNTADDFFVGNGVADVTIRYGVAGDTYRYASGNVRTTITLAQFEEYLSAGDTVFLDGSYNPGANNFIIDTDVPAAPTNLAGSLTNADAGATANDAALTWTAPANPDLGAYVVEQATVTNGVVGAFTTATDADTSQTNAQASVRNLDAGTYAFRVSATNSSGAKSLVSNVVQVTVSAQADALAPRVSGPVVVIENSPMANPSTPAETTVGAGDQINIPLSERVALTADAQVHLLDDDGTVSALQRGVNATFTLNTAGTLLIISVTGNPVLLSAGTTQGEELTLSSTGALKVVNSVGIADAAANPLAEIGVTSIVASATNDNVVVTFDSPIDPSSITATDLTVTNNRVVGTPVASVNNTVFTFPVASLTAADVATLRANAAVGAFGGNGPAAAAPATA